MKELRFHGDLIVTGLNSIDYLQKVPAQRVMIITGGGSMFNNNTIPKIERIFQEKGASVETYSGIKPNPTTTEICDAINKAKEFKPDTVIGVGGGSALDASKIIALFYEYPELNFDFAKTNPLPEKRQKTKLIIIPSTSGTAAEITKAAVVTYKEDNIKIGLKTTAFISDIAILDGNITMSMPLKVVAETGMDAMTHAVECFINKNADDFAQCLAKGAIEGLFKYLPQSYQRGDALSREKVHNFQAMAGCAFANVGLGMAHGISHAIGGMFNYGHGLINAIALPYVLKYNSQDEEVKNRLATLAKAIDSYDFIAAIEDLNKSLDIPRTFQEMGIEKDQFQKNFDELVRNSLKNATLLNPIPMNKDEMEKVLWNIYFGE